MMDNRDQFCPRCNRILAHCRCRPETVPTPAHATTLHEDIAFLISANESGEKISPRVIAAMRQKYGKAQPPAGGWVSVSARKPVEGRTVLTFDARQGAGRVPDTRYAVDCVTGGKFTKGVTDWWDAPLPDPPPRLGPPAPRQHATLDLSHLTPERAIADAAREPESGIVTGGSGLVRTSFPSIGEGGRLCAVCGSLMRQYPSGLECFWCKYPDRNAGVVAAESDAALDMLRCRDAAWSKAIGSVIGYDAEACGSVTPEHMRQMLAAWAGGVADEADYGRGLGSRDGRAEGRAGRRARAGEDVLRVAPGKRRAD